ncbi:MAG: endonuclease/exonuclease/phosphatase family protein [Candidatus Kariarchaeaceae archaeon]|jgi:endonuclease/exonuclease/phosphatase family metal-dependent hydrolase
MEVRVLTYNAALHFPGYADFLRADKLRKFLLDGDWDIIGLCEVYHPSLRKVLLEDKLIKEKYPTQVFGLSQYGFVKLDNGTVILSKYQLKSTKRLQYKNFHNVWYNKIVPPKDVIFAELLHEGNSIGVFVTHLQWGNLSKQPFYRKKHIIELKHFIQTSWGFRKPFIVMGDFNTHGEEEYQFLMKELGDVSDWWYDTNDIEKLPGYTWNPANTKVVVPYEYARLDYIFSHKSVKPIKTDLVRFKSSLRNILWKPDLKLNKKEKIWFFVARLLRIITVPLLILMILLFDIYRAFRKLPLLIFFPNRDLSDHYGVEGIAEFEA